MDIEPVRGPKRSSVAEKVGTKLREVSRQVGDASERTFGHRIATGSVSTEPENQRHTKRYESRPYDAPECDRPGLAAYQPEVINKQSAYDHENR